MIRLGIDIGGSAIKAALVDLQTGSLVSERMSVKNTIETEPLITVEGIKNIAKRLNYSGPMGIGFPGRLKDSTVMNAPNLHPKWTGTHLKDFISVHTNQKVGILNDADAAALAELEFGNTQIKNTHRVIFLTLGTGIGSAFILNGQIWKDTELGHLLINGDSAELYAAASIKRIEKLSWKQWATRLNVVLERYDFLFSPDLFVLGGAISVNLPQFIKYLSFSPEKVIAATLGNNAGIIGAALSSLDK